MKCNKKIPAILFVLIGLAFFVRFYGLDRLSFWVDEAHSIFMTRFSLWDYFAAPVYFDHPPLYFLLLKGWMMLGASDWWLRAFSALIGGLTVIPLYFLARDIANRRAALCAVLFLALNPFHVRYCQEVRQYALLFLLTVLLIFLCWRWKHKPTRMQEALYLACGVLLAATHVMGILFLLCQAIIVCLLLLPRQRLAMRWFKLNFVLGFLSLPFIYLLLSHSLHKMESGFWLEPPGWQEIASVLSDFLYTYLPSLNYFLYKLFSLKLPYIPIEQYAFIPFLILSALALFLLWKHNRSVFYFILLPSLAFFTLSILISHVSVPIFSLRTMIACLLIVPLLLAYPLSWDNRDWRILTVWFLTGLCLLITAVSLYTEFKQWDKPHWRELTRYLANHIENGECILIHGYAADLAVRYYADRYAIDAPIHAYPQSFQDAFFTPNLFFDEIHQYPPRGMITACKGIWVVKSKYEEIPPILRQTLGMQGFALQDRQAFIAVDLMHFLR
ncbi:hypothetical protein GF373_10730 [bacterium]|nr:hypothetical protein [bacterium]